MCKLSTALCADSTPPHSPPPKKKKVSCSIWWTCLHEWNINSASLYSPRLTAQPVCLTRSLCQVPPEKSKKAKETISDKNDEAKEDLPKSQNAGTEKEDKGLSHEAGHLTKEKAELKPSEASIDSSAKEDSAEGNQDKTDKKPARQKKLHDLLSTLASVRNI